MTDFNLSLNKVLGERIRERRNKLGLNQDDLAQAIGLNRASISNIESGKHQISLSALFQLARVIHTEIHFLLPTYEDIKQRMNIANTELDKILENTDLDDNARLSVKNILENL